MHPAVIHSTKWKHTPVKCCNNTSRLINQAQMRKKFPQGFGKTNNIISRLLSHNKITPTNNQTIGLQTVQNSTLWSNLADESWHLSFHRLCLLNLCNQCELCLRPLHVCRRARSVRWGLWGEMALSWHHDSLISCFPHHCYFTTGLCVAIPH